MSLNPTITTDSSTKLMTVQILFIDSFVDDIEILLKGTFPGIETIILSAQEDGVTQITEVLKQRQNVETVHIVSHGAPGLLYLGNSELSLNTLKDYASQLQECSRENLNLLLYGCNVAAGDAGEEFLNKLHSLIGANIAASATKTGNAALGGDWNLEVTVGEIVPQLAFNHQAIANYASILAPTVSFNVSSVFDADVLVNRTGGVTDTTQTAIDLTNNALITQSFATFSNSTSGNGLPDNGFFAATSFNPDIQLSYRNTDNGNNARLIKTSTGSFTFNVSGQYAYVHLALTSTEGTSDVRLTLNYSDGTTQTTNSQTIPDWYNEITPSNTLYYLSNGLDRSKADGTGFEDANNPAVFGVRFSANAAKTLQSITVEKTASTGYLVFFGATGELTNAPALTGTPATLSNGTEDTAYTITATSLLQGFTDVDGDTLSVSNLTATNGSVINNGNGTYTFTPNANYNGTINLSYNVTDGKGGSTAATRSFSLAAVNDAPALTGTAATLSNGTEDTAYTITATNLLQGFTDVDGDTLSVSNLSATNGTVINNGNGTYTFNPNANYNGTVSLSYNVTDGKGGSTAITSTFSLAAVNDAPTPTVTVSFNVSSVFDTDVIVNRTAGITDTTQTAIDLTNYALITQSFATFANSTSGNGLPDDGFFAATSFHPDIQLSYRNTDNGNNARLIKTSTGSFTFNVSGQYAYVHLALTSTEGNSDVRLTLNYSDGTTETTNSQTIPDWYNEITPSNTLYYLSNDLDRSKTDGTGFEDANDPALFGVRFSANAAKTLQSITVEKTASTGYLVFLGATGELTNAPALSNGTEDTAYTINAANLLQGFTDVDGDTLSVSNLTATNGTVINNGNGTYTFNPNANYNGTVSLSYNVTDGKGGSTAATRTFSLAAVNDAPALTGTAATLSNGTEDTAYTITATSLLQGFTDVDGDTLSVSNLTATNGTVINNGNGTYTFTPNANYNGTVNLSYNVTDGKGGSTAATRTFSLAAVNDAPALTGTPATLSNGTEDIAYTITATSLLQGFTDVDGDTLSVSGLTATNGGVADNGNGTYTFTPNANYNGSVTLSYNVIDGKGSSTAATRSFSLAAVNDAPALTGTAATISNGTEDTAYTITATSLLQGFTDVDGDNLSVSGLTATNGGVADNGNGTYTFTPNANYNGTVNLSYNVTDGKGGSTATTRTFSLAAVNDAPALTGTAATLSNGTEDTAYTITATSLLQGFTDVDGDNLSVSGLTATNGGVADNGNGTYTFTPNANYNGTVNLSYNVTDGKGGSTAATRTFSLAAVNDAPALTGTAATLSNGTEDTPYTITATSLLQGFTDVDGDTLSVSGLTATNGTVINNGNGTYTFNPNANYKGLVTLNYNVIDGNGGSTVATSTFNLVVKNDAPALTGTAATLGNGIEDTTYTISAISLLQGFTDIDGDTLSVSNLSATNGSVVDNSNGSYTFSPNTNYNGLVTLNYNVIDGNGGSTAAISTFSLAAVNDAPTLTEIPATLSNGRKDTAYTISATNLLQGFTDVDGDSLSVSNLTVTNGTIINNGNGTYTFNPNANYNGLVTLNYNVIDGNGGSTAAISTFSITEVNEAPVLGAAASGSLDYAENAGATKISSTSLKITDVDNTNINSAIISITGNYQNGQDFLSIIGTLPTGITAGEFDSTTGTISLTGSATLANYTTALTRLAYSNISDDPNILPRTVSFTVNDGTTNSNTVTRTINVMAVNDAPALTETGVTLSNSTEDTAYTITATSLLQGFTDVEGDTLSVSNLTATNGTVTDNGDETYTFNPNVNYNGLVTLNYKVIDGKGGTTAATLTFSLISVNDAPTLTGTAATLSNGREDTAYIISAAKLLQGFTDLDGDSLSVFGLTATNGIVTQTSDGSYTFNPDANYNGTVTLTYNVTDGEGGSTPATLTFNLAAVNDAPTLTGTAAILSNGVEDTAYTITTTSLLEGFTDVDGDILSVSNLTAINGTVTKNGDESYTFKPSANYNGTVTLSYNVTDNKGGSIGKTSTFTLVAVNDAPVLGAAASGSLAYTENATATSISSTGLGITDVDSTSITGATISITGNYQNGQDILSVIGVLPTGITAGAFDVTSGTITLTGSASLADYTKALAQIAYNNSSENPNISDRTVSFTVNDGTSNSNTVARTIKVTPVNDAPVLGAAASGSLAYTENAPATSISSTGLGITDVDNTNITSAIISIIGNYQKGQDILSIIDTLPTGITAGVFNATTGTITLTGNAAVADYTTALAQVAYTNTSDNPNILPRTVSFTVNDGKNNSNTVTRAIKVIPVNDAPVLGAAASGSLAYTENAPATSISSTGLGITDVDNTSIISATISIIGNYQNGQDILSVIGTLPTGITTGAFNATTGTITLTGSASLADYTKALAQIAYNNSSENPNISDRTVSFTVNDGTNNSNTVIRNIKVIPVNDAPVLGAAASGSLAYIENAPATSISSTGLGITDVDNTNITSATISITGNYQKGQDILSVIDALPTGITAGVFNATTGTITLTGSATLANYTTALAQVAYSNTSDNPNISDRTVNFTVNDGTANSNTITRAIKVTPVNDAPVLSAAASGSLTYTENATATSISSTGLGITDIDNTNISSATISITGNYQKGQDILSIIGTLPTGITAGTFNTNTGTITLTGNATLADYTKALAKIAYNNSSENPNISDRTVSFTVNDGTNNSNTVNLTVKVNPVNDAPVLGAAASGSLAYIENAPATSISSTGLAITDVDNTNITSAIVSITGNYQKGQDFLSVLGTLPTGITAAAFDITTGTITLTGNATLANYTTALAQVAYSNTSDNPNILLRTVSFTVNDGKTNSNAVTRTINVTAVNDAPVLSAATSGNLVYTKKETKISSTGLEITDIDNINITSATISITGNYQKGEDILSVSDKLPTGIIASAFDSITGTITLTGSATFDKYKTVLQQIAYSNTSENPNIGDRTISFTVNDGTNNSNTVTRNINVVLAYMNLGDSTLSEFFQSFKTLAEQNLNNIKFTRENNLVKLTYLGKLEVKDLINKLELGTTTKSFSLNNPSLIVKGTGNQRTYQVSIPKINLNDFLGLLTDLGGITLPTNIKDKLPLGDVDLVLSNQGISLNFANDFNLDLGKVFSLDSVIPFIDTAIDGITTGIFGTPNLTLSQLGLNLSNKNNKKQLKLSGLLNGNSVDFSFEKTNTTTKTTFDYKLANTIDFGQLAGDIPILNSFKIQNPELILTTEAYNLNSPDLGNLKLTKGFNFIGNLNFAEVNTYIGKFIHDKLGIGNLNAYIGINPAGLINFTGIVPQLTNASLINVGDFTANLDNFSLGFEIKNLNPVLRVSGGLKLKGYDFVNPNEPELLLSGGLELDPKSLTGYFNLNADTPWINPFGMKDTTIRKVGLQLGGTYAGGLDNFGFLGDFEFGNLNINTAFIVDTNEPNRVALTLTTIKPLKLLDLYLGPVNSFIFNQLKSKTNLVGDALDFLNKIIDVKIESIDSDGDGKLDPLVQFVPFATEIAGETLEEGFAINGKLTAWGKSATLTFNSNPSLTNIAASLKVTEIDLKVLKITGVDDKELNLDLKFSPSEQYLKGNGRIEIFGQNIAQAEFSITPTSATIKNVFLGIPNVLSISVPILTVDLANLANLKASGSGQIKLFNQTLAGGDFTLDKDGFKINAQLGISSLLSVEFNDVVVNKSGASGSAKINIAGTELANGSLSLNANGFSLKGNLGVSAGDFGNIGLSVSVNVGTDVDKINASIDFDVLSQHVNLVSVSLKDFTDIGSLVINAALDVVGSIPGYITDLINDGLATISSVGSYLVEAGSNLMNAAVQYFKDTFGWGQSASIQFNGGNGNDTKHGNDNKDVLFGNEGDDSLHGHFDDDLIDGGSGNDSLAGGNGKDTIFGGDGNDVIWGQNQDDMLYGWAGDDYINGDGDIKETYDGGNDFIDGGIGNDRLDGGYGNDTIYGSAGNDRLDGGDGNDLLDGGDGNDLLEAGNGDDRLDGGDGYDFLYGRNGDDTIYGSAGDDYINGLSDNDRLDGGDGNDTLYGDVGNDTLYGGEGKDKLYGEDGNDYLNGYKDSDTLDGGAGDDLLFGQQSNDSLSGGDGNDTLYGEDDGTQSQTYDGSQDNDTLNGGAGNDYLSGGVGNDSLSGGAGQDTLYGDVGNDTLYGDVGNDTLYGGEGKDKLYGGEGNDYLNGYKDSDTLDGGAGNDLLFGQQSNDSLYGGDGNDTLYGEDDGTQSQTYDGSQDNDTLNGGAGNDFLFGGVGDDYLKGGNDSDILYGGVGNDILYGEAGTDTLYGGDGNDILYAGTAGSSLYGGDGNDYLNGSDGNDYLNGGNGIDTLNGGNGNDTADCSFWNSGITANLSLQQVTFTGSTITQQFISIENIIGSMGNDTLVGDIGKNNLTGGAGNDSLNGGDGDDYLSGGDGNDTLNGGNGLDVLIGGAGNDSLNGGDGDDYLSGGDGNDTLNGENGNDTAEYIGEIADIYRKSGIIADLNLSFMTFSDFSGTQQFISIENISGSVNDDQITGDSQNNKLEGRQGNDYLTGGGGDDTLNGGAGNDSLLGGLGNDSLLGGLGNDSLLGGLGADKFNFIVQNEGIDRIQDFSRLEGDKILIKASNFGTGVTLQKFNFNYSSNTLFFNNQQIAILDNVTNSNFSVSQDVTLI
ncbi:hemolysin-type calcium-binding region (plasmid) [Nostoc linckia NIES-25]|nr:hemolysin-type calcium-binding region [Nostoc linckia NIES-25]